MVTRNTYEQMVIACVFAYLLHRFTTIKRTATGMSAHSVGTYGTD